MAECENIEFQVEVFKFNLNDTKNKYKYFFNDSSPFKHYSRAVGFYYHLGTAFENETLYRLLECTMVDVKIAFRSPKQDPATFRKSQSSEPSWHCGLFQGEQPFLRGPTPHFFES